MDLFKAITTRKSTRSYRPDQISGPDLDAILKAGCAAPVGMSAYDTLHLTVVQNREKLDKINQTAARAIRKEGFKAIYDAPTLVIVSAIPSEIMPNIEYANGACIIQNMLLAATALGIDSVYLWAFLRGLAANSALMRELEIPDGSVPVSGLALGYAKNPSEKEKGLKLIIGLNIVK